MHACVSPLGQWPECQGTAMGQARFQSICRFDAQYRRSAATNHVRAVAGKNTRTAAGASRKDRSVVHLLVALDFFRLIKLVGCDLELVTIGIAKIDGVRNFVIFEFELDAAALEFFLRGEKTVAIGTKGQM